MHYLSQFHAFWFPTQNQQNVKILPLIAQTWNLQHWIQHVLNPKYALLKPFLMHFSNWKPTKCEILAVSLTPPDKNKKASVWTGKKFEKAWISAHIGFWVYQICTMHYVRTNLCDKYILSYYSFLHFFDWNI